MSSHHTHPDPAVRELIAQAEERGYLAGHEKGLLDPGSAWMKARADELAQAEARGAERVHAETLTYAADMVETFEDIESAKRCLRHLANSAGATR